MGCCLFAVDFIQGDEKGALKHLWIISSDFAAKYFIIVGRVSAIDSRSVQNEDQEFSAFDVAQEFKAESAVFVSPFDDSWNVGDVDAFVVFQLNKADIGLQCCEGVRGDLNLDISER